MPSGHRKDSRSAGAQSPSTTTGLGSLRPFHGGAANASIFPIEDFETELTLVRNEATRLLDRSGVPLAPREDVLEILVTTFRELRKGESADGTPMERLGTVMSTAECVAVAHEVGVRGYYTRGDAGTPADVVECLSGTAAKGDTEDLRRIRRYLEQRVARKSGTHWEAFYEARHRLPG